MNEGDFVHMKMTGEQIALAQKFERVVEDEIRRILEQLGVNVNRDTEVPTIQRQMAILSIEVIHVNYDDKPAESGWYVKQHGKKLIKIFHPTINKRGRIILKRRVYE